MAGITELQTLQVQRVVSNLAAGVKWAQDFIIDRCCSMVNTGSENFAYSTWGNEGLRLVETRRGLNAEPNKITIGSGTATGELEEHTLETFYDYRRLKAAQEAGTEDQFRLNHAAALRQLVQIKKEKQCADIIFGASYYGSNTASNVNFSSTGIRDTVLAQKDALQRSSGVRPNKFVVGQTTHRFLLKNADIMNTIQYARGGITTAQVIADYFEVDEYLVGSAVYQASAAAGAAGTATSIWPVDSAALIYTDSEANTASPSFAKCFYMNSPLSGSQSLVRTWVPDPGLMEHMLYSEYFKCAQVFSAAGYLWTNTDQV